MATVYILYSIKLNKHYIGSCLEINKRLEQHMDKIFPKAYTKRSDDWVVKFCIPHLNQNQARLIEKHIKKMKSIAYINNLIKYPEMTQKLIDKYRAGSFR